MPIRKNGDSIVFYDQAVQEWKKATVERYIRGYGYQVNYEEDGSSYQGKLCEYFVVVRCKCVGVTRKLLRKFGAY